MKTTEDFLREVTITELVTPQMANFNGNLHGGILLSIVDKAAYVVASRYSGEYCVTASFDQVTFLAPIFVGELLTFLAKVIGVGKTSMQVRIIVVAEDLKKRSVRKVNTCLVTMVAFKEGKSISVRRLPMDSLEKKTDFLYSLCRKELSLAYRKKIQEFERKIQNMTEAEVEEELAKRRAE